MRRDPQHGFRFRVEVNQVEHGGFTRVKGLMRETKVETRREGGVNDYEHKFATSTSYSNLILERGLLDSFLWDWHDDVIEGKIERKTITIVLLNEMREEVWRWLVERAFPVKWTGTDFDAMSAQVTFESVELAHEGIWKG